MPGGTASYPSSVLMNAVPAKVAGVPRVVMVVPAPEGRINPLVLAAARVAGVDEIYRVGGAQAVAALAYGTQTIAPVAKIVGPGNAYVAAAKRRVFGTVGIDMIAGPSEVLIIADASANPGLDRRRPAGAGRARHGRAVHPHHRRRATRRCRRRSRWSGSFRHCRARTLRARAGATSARSSWSRASPTAFRSSTASRPSISKSCPRTPKRLSARVRNAGAIFIGGHTPEAIGDYVGGSNHVLPTARSARFSSGLGVLDFMKRTSILKCSPRRAARARAGGDRAGRGGRARRARALGRHPHEPSAEPMNDAADPTRRLSPSRSTRNRSAAARRIRSTSARRDLRSDREQPFALPGHDGGPYALHISLHDKKLALRRARARRRDDRPAHPFADAVPPDC